MRVFIAAILFLLPLTTQGAESLDGKMTKLLTKTSQSQTAQENPLRREESLKIFQSWIGEPSVESRNLIMKYLLRPEDGSTFSIDHKTANAVVSAILQSENPTLLPAALAYCRNEAAKIEHVNYDAIIQYPKVVDTISRVLAANRELMEVIRDGFKGGSYFPTYVQLQGLAEGGIVHLRPNHDSTTLVRAVHGANGFSAGVSKINYGPLPEVAGDVVVRPSGMDPRFMSQENKKRATTDGESIETTVQPVAFQGDLLDVVQFPRLAIEALRKGNRDLIDQMMAVRDQLTHETPVTREQYTEALLNELRKIDVNEPIRLEVEKKIREFMVRTVMDPYLSSEKARSDAQLTKHPTLLPTLLLNNNDGADLALARYLMERPESQGFLNKGVHVVLFTGSPQQFVDSSDTVNTGTNYVPRVLLEPLSGKTLSDVLDPKNFVKPRGRYRSVPYNVPETAYWRTHGAYQRQNSHLKNGPRGSITPPASPCPSTYTAASAL